jgi:cell wall-associated NlpC family hydrolase
VPAASGYGAATLVSAPSSPIGAQVVAVASRYLGRPYVFGAAGPRAFDCSGLTQFVFAQFGVHLPHSAGQQRYDGRPVSAADARPGDIVVFYLNGSWGHVGIYIGGGYMIDAPHTGAVVRKDRIWSSHIQFRRLIG